MTRGNKIFILSLPYLLKIYHLSLSIYKHDAIKKMLIPQADHTLCLWLIIVDMRRIKSMRAMNKALNVAYLNYISV